MRRYRTLILIVLLGVVPVTALIAGTWLYFGEQAPPEPEPIAAPAPEPEPAPEAPAPVEVLSAARDLTVGTLLTANDVIYVPINPDNVFSTHLQREQTEASDVFGSVVRGALLAGTPLTWQALVRPGEDGFLAAALRPDYRAVTIVVSQATSHAGLISPGDRVDVIFTMRVEGSTGEIGSFSRTVLENIRVVAVNRRVGGATDAGAEESGQDRGGQAGRGNTVTLEVLPAEADRLVLATTRGSISLALRPLIPSERVGWRPPTGVGTLLPPPATEPPDPRQVKVQVFRGNRHEEVLLAK